MEAYKSSWKVLEAYKSSWKALEASRQFLKLLEASRTLQAIGNTKELYQNLRIRRFLQYDPVYLIILQPNWLYI